MNENDMDVLIDMMREEGLVITKDVNRKLRQFDKNVNMKKVLKMFPCICPSKPCTDKNCDCGRCHVR